MLTRTQVSLLIIALAFNLTACGGGGGSASEVQPPVATPPALGPGQVATTEGTYQGETVGNLLVFKGISYAAPPVGTLRFKAPEPPASFSNVRDALAFGSVCTQPQGSSTTGSEDCLFLNIWGHNDDTVRPVMVYMHPGSSGDIASINPQEFAEAADVVVVNLNRRLGAGFYRRGSQPNVRYDAINVGPFTPKLYAIPDLEVSVRVDQQTAQDVAKGMLHGKREGESADAEAGEHWSDVIARIVEGDDNPDGPEDRIQAFPKQWQQMVVQTCGRILRQRHEISLVQRVV